jgi:hypothetical protein
MTTYYVSTTGSDSAAGSLDQPFASLQHAHDLAKPGDTIYLRGGTYVLDSGIHLTNDGTSGKPITVANYPGEHPVLDGSKLSSEYSDGWPLELNNASWNHIKGLEISDGPEGGLMIRGASNSNIIEALDVHHNGRLSEWEGKGISLLGSGSNNLLLNNDSHDNRDLRGDNADGFQVSTTGSGNVLRGNRAWNNSDDGYDFFNVEDNSKAGALLIENNWAFNNGVDENGNPVGDGNGFKLGGSRPGTSSTSGGHTVIGNVAWDNQQNGFDENNSTAANKLYNNTSYDNGGYNYGFWEVSNTFKNNVSFGTGKLATSGSSQNNSWDLSSAPKSTDFASLNDSIARGDRQADGTLPTNEFLHLSSKSSLIDKGVDVGREYAGLAPDLGSYEAGSSAGGVVVADGGQSTGNTSTTGGTATTGGTGTTGGTAGGTGGSGTTGNTSTTGGTGNTGGTGGSGTTGNTSTTGGTGTTAGADGAGTGSDTAGSHWFPTHTAWGNDGKLIWDISKYTKVGASTTSQSPTVSEQNSVASADVEASTDSSSGSSTASPPGGSNVGSTSTSTGSSPVPAAPIKTAAASDWSDFFSGNDQFHFVGKPAAADTQNVATSPPATQVADVNDAGGSVSQDGLQDTHAPVDDVTHDSGHISNGLDAQLLQIFSSYNLA